MMGNAFFNIVFRLLEDIYLSGAKGEFGSAF